jgi:hypothetical protein
MTALRVSRRSRPQRHPRGIAFCDIPAGTAGQPFAREPPLYLVPEETRVSDPGIKSPACERHHNQHGIARAVYEQSPVNC